MSESQAIVFAAADGVGTLTEEDAEALRGLLRLDLSPLPVL